jgi:hypothetical protein
MHPQRAVQADDPAALPPDGRRIAPSVPLSARPDSAEAVRQIAGGLAALAGKVDRMGEVVTAGLRPRVTTDDRRKALDVAREFISELGLPPRYERVHAELAVARYLTGE